MPRGHGEDDMCTRCVLTWSLAPGVPCLAGVARERGGGGIGEETMGHSSWPPPAPAAARDAGYPRPTFGFGLQCQTTSRCTRSRENLGNGTPPSRLGEDQTRGEEEEAIITHQGEGTHPAATPAWLRKR